MKKSAGFTLIELMIVVAIVSILLAIAIPSYNNQMRKSRRAEAKQILSDLMLKQEKWRSNNATYGTSLPAPAASNIPIPGTTITAYYNITMTTGSNTATGYVYVATPKGDQAQDSCGTLTLQMGLGGVIQKLPAPATTPGCW